MLTSLVSIPRTSRIYSRPEFARTFWCDSWLLNPALEEITPGSNLAHFARRWRIAESLEDVDGVVFFVFDRRPPYDLEDLPSTTRLERAIRERLLDGRGWHRGIGAYSCTRSRRGAHDAPADFRFCRRCATGRRNGFDQDHSHGFGRATPVPALNQPVAVPGIIMSGHKSLEVSLCNGLVRSDGGCSRVV